MTLERAGQRDDETQVNVSLVSGDYFSTLGLQPAVGRLFTPDDDRSLGAHPVVVISHDFWERRFARAKDIVGRTLKLIDTTYTIVGVAPRGFSGDWIGKPTDFWIPFMMQSQVMPDVPGLQRYPARVLGRLKPGVTIQQAQAASQVLYHQLLTEAASANVTAQQPSQLERRHLELEPAAGGYSPQRVSLSQPLMILMVVVGLVLLIACANIANLLLARVAARQREIVVRMALGAMRWQIVRQLLTESFLLATAGGALGLVFAMWGTDLLVPMLASGTAAVTLDLQPDMRMFAFTATVCFTTGMLFGLVPALRSSKVALTPSLTGRGGALGATPRTFGFGRMLVVSQVALSLVLLIGAGLFARTLRNLKSQDLGFDREHVLLILITPVQTGRVGPALVDLWKAMQEKLSNMPGVLSASASLGGMVNGSERGNGSEFIRLEGKDRKAGLLVSDVGVAPKFFQTVGVPLLRGRDFSERDTDTAPRVVIISETLARFLFGDEDPVGKRFGWSYQTDFPFEIVGVAKDAKHGTPQDNRGFFYCPYGQKQNWLRGTWCLSVRTAGDPLAMTARVREEIRAIDERLAVAKIQTIEDQLSDVLVKERLIAALSGWFGGLAVLLACLGLYGVVSYTVTRRTNEIGLRLALGSTTSSVLRMILKESFWLVMAGIVIGLPATLALTRLISSRLFGVGPADPLTVVSATALMFLVALLAALLPARRAAKVHPMEALRYE